MGSGFIEVLFEKPSNVFDQIFSLISSWLKAYITNTVLFDILESLWWPEFFASPAHISPRTRQFSGG